MSLAGRHQKNIQEIQYVTLSDWMQELLPLPAHQSTTSPPTHQYKCKSYNLLGLCGLRLIAANCLYKMMLRKVTGSVSSASLPRPKLRERGEHLSCMFTAVCWTNACSLPSFHQPENHTKPHCVTRNWRWKQLNYEKLFKYGFDSQDPSRF